MNDEKGGIKDWLSDRPVGDPDVSVNKRDELWGSGFGSVTWFCTLIFIPLIYAYLTLIFPDTMKGIGYRIGLLAILM
jgi:hypothetical protein